MSTPIRDALPFFRFKRGGIPFVATPTLDMTSHLTFDELVAWRAHQRIRRDRQAAWNARVQQHCVCRYTTITNGDSYEDETVRVDGTTCPVHGEA